MVYPKDAFITLNDGHKIPVLGLGTWQAEEGEVGRAVDAALRSGLYVHVDCAQIYDNQEEIGETFHKLFEEGIVKRENVFVTSKLWLRDLHPSKVRAAAERILKELRLSFLDLLLIHWPIVHTSQGEVDPSVDLRDTWVEMEKLVDAGLVRSIGVSNFTIEKIEHIARGQRIQPAVNQVELHPYLPQHKLLKWCADHKIVLTAYSPLGSGRGGLLDDQKIAGIAKKHGKSPAQVLIRWAIQRKTVVIPKSVHEERIKDNAKVFDFSLDGQDMAEIDSIYKTQRKRFIDPASYFKVATIFGKDDSDDL
eukprot:ANDGO_04955.mRNA.1 Aldose reductase A